MAGSNFDPFVGQPVRSVQTYLRRISHTYEEVPRVIPDGQYGEQTKNAVMGFQKVFRINPTGVVDKETWDKILRVHSDILLYEGEPMPVQVYPGGKYVILPGEQSENLYVIQSMMLVISSRFINISTVQVTGISDAQNVNTVMQLQKAFGMKETGVIEKQFWDNLTKLYEAKVSRNRFNS